MADVAANTEWLTADTKTALEYVEAADKRLANVLTKRIASLKTTVEARTRRNDAGATDGVDGDGGSPGDGGEDSTKRSSASWGIPSAALIGSFPDNLPLGGNTPGWAAVDIRAALDPAGAAAVVRGRVETSTWLGGLEFLRNALVVVPILITWGSLQHAASSYNRYITANPAEARQPLLLLWQRNFQPATEKLEWYAPTLSNSALAVLLVLALMLVLTVIIHAWRDAGQADRERQAALVERELGQLALLASLVLSGGRDGATAPAAFALAANGLLGEMRAERALLRDLADERLRVVGALDPVSSKLERAASDLEKLGDALRPIEELNGTAAEWQAANLTLAGEVARVAEKQTDLHREHAQLIESLRSAATLMAQADVRAAQAAAALPSAVEGLTKELKQLRIQLGEERRQYEQAAQAAERAAAALARSSAEAAIMVAAVEDARPGIEVALSGLQSVPGKLIEAARRQDTAAGALSKAASDVSGVVDVAGTKLSGANGALSRLAPLLTEFADEIERARPGRGGDGDSTGRTGRRSAGD